MTTMPQALQTLISRQDTDLQNLAITLWDIIDTLQSGDVVGPASAVTLRVAVFNGTTGKLIADGGMTIAQIIATATSGTVVGPVGAVADNLPSFNGVSGVIIKDSGIGALTVVVGPVAATNNDIAVYDGVTGKLIKDGGSTIAQVIAAAVAASGDVVGPAGATADNIAVYNGVTGKLIKDGGQTVAQVIAAAIAGSGDVVGPAGATADNIATYNGVTGKLIKDGGSTIAQVIATATASGGQQSCTGVLTLAPGIPYYQPQPATPSSTDTTAETCTFAAAHGWVTGTIVTVSATVGGLTAGTRYYLNALSATSVAFYTTVANAEADASRVNLTASITSIVIPSGISRTSIRFTPINGNVIGLYFGGAWSVLTFAELNIALGTLTSAIGYEVFAYNNSGVVALELLAWTDGVSRATALVLQDGIKVKSGDATRRYIGSFYTNTTTTTIDDGGGIATQVGGQRFLYSAYNRKQRYGRVKDTTSSWNYSTATWRQANGAAGNKCEWFQGLSEDVVDVELRAETAGSAASAEGSASIAIDSTTLPDVLATIALGTVGAATTGVFSELPCKLSRFVAVGYHSAVWLERGNTTITTSFYGWDSSANNRLTGLMLTTWQ